MTKAATSSANRPAAGSDLGRGLGGATLAVIVWGASGVVAKRIDMGGIAIGVYRFGLYAIALTAWMAARKAPLTVRGLKHSLLGGIALGLDIALFFSAIKLTTIVNATVVTALQPLLVMLAAVIFFDEKITRRDLLLGATALAGVAIVVFGSTSSPEWNLQGDIIALGALVAWAGYFIFSKHAQQSITSVEYTAGTATIAAIINLPLAIAFGQDLSWPTAESWKWLLILTVGAGIIGHSLMNWSLQRIPLWVGSTLTLLIPVASAALGWAWLGESLGAMQIVGMAIVLGALGLVVRGQAQAATTNA